MASEIAWNPELWTAAGGSVPSDWDLIPFGDLLQAPKSITVGVMYPGEQTDGGVPLIRVGDVGDGGVVQQPGMSISQTVHYEYRRTELCGDELLITLVGTPGVCVVARPEMRGWNVARALAVARLKRPELRPYIKAVMESSVMRSIITGMLNTTVQPTLNLKEIKILPLPMPRDPRAAKALGDVAELFNERIALLNQTNATLEATAQTLFKSWFVDFEPVRAKAEGREPEGMDAATAASFPGEFEDSELGPIPKGWRRVRFGDVAALSKGSVNPMARPDQTFLHYSLPAFDAGQLPLPEAGEAIKSSKTPVPSGAVLVSKLNPHIPRIWSVGDVEDHSVCSTEFLVWTPKSGVGGAFVYCLASSAAFNIAMRQLVTGTSNSHQRVKPDQLSEVQAAVVSDEVIVAFDSISAPLLQQVERNRHRAATLAALRDTLLPRLISGKLRLPEAAAALDETVESNLFIEPAGVR